MSFESFKFSFLFLCLFLSSTRSYAMMGAGANLGVEVAQNQNINEDLQSVINSIRESNASSCLANVVGIQMRIHDFRALSEILSTAPHLKHLYLGGLYLNKQGIHHLLRNLHLSSLETFALPQAGLDDDDVLQLAAAIQSTGIWRLYLSYNQIGPNGGLRLAYALKDCGLRELVLDHNEIGHEGALAIAEVLGSTSTTLTKLDLGSNELSEESAIAVINGVSRSRVISLALDGNNLSDNLAPGLSALLDRTHLETLSFSRNNLTDQGFRSVIVALKHSNWIESVDLSGNVGITDAVVPELLDAIHSHRTLKMLDLEETGISDQNRNKINEALARLHTHRSELLTALTSSKLPPKGSRSIIGNLLSKDIFRRLKRFLPEEK